MNISFSRNAPTLLLDCHSILHAMRFHIKKYAEDAESARKHIIYGFLAHVNMLMETFSTTKFLFAWDHPTSIRKQEFDFYKQRRPAASVPAHEADIDVSIIKTFGIIREAVVPRLGFAHNHYHEGYEADDILAAAVMGNTGNYLIVSSDHDLMQLLNKCSMYRHKNGDVYTDRMFFNEHGIDCTQWAEVKAIAGCTSDTVPGIEGVGEKTAIKYLRGELKPTTKAHANIVSEKGQQIIQRNRRIVTLPLAGCPVPDLTVLSEMRPTKHVVDELSEQFGLAANPKDLRTMRGVAQR